MAHVFVIYMIQNSFKLKFFTAFCNYIAIIESHTFFLFSFYFVGLYCCNIQIKILHKQNKNLFLNVLLTV